MAAGDVTRTVEMKPLVSDLEYYSEAYRAYARFSENKLKLYQKWAGDVFKSKGVDTLRDCFSDVEELRVLGIGSGAGEIDACLLEQLSARFPRISNTVVEPSSESIAAYASLVQQKEKTLSGVNCRFLQTTIQEFRAKIKSASSEAGEEPRSKFHFIHAIQSLYYAADLKGTISDLYDSLEEGGVMLIVIMTDEHVIYRMWDNFPFIVSEQQGLMANLSSSDIVRTLQQLRLSYNPHTISWRTEMSPCFDPDSNEGSKILDFLTHTIHFRVTAPDKLREKVMSFLRSICSTEDYGGKTGGTPSDSGEGPRKYYFIRDWQSLFIYRI